MSSTTLPRDRLHGIESNGATITVRVAAPRPAPGPRAEAHEETAHLVDRLHELATEVEQLRTALVSRATIEQAKGVLMLLTSCGDQGSFDLLAHIASHTHRKVRHVAREIVESASGPHALPSDIRSILADACPPPRH